MTIKEINKLLSDKNISPELKESLEKKKEALIKNINVVK